MTKPDTSEYAFIVNPAAKSFRALNVFNRIRPLIEKEFPDAGIFIAGGKDLKELCEEVSKNYSVIIACGGDGTVHHVGSTLINRDITMGILPIGSGNDIAFSLGYPKKIVSCFNCLKVFQKGTMDVIEVNGLIGLNTIGIGLDGYVNLLANNRLKIFKKLRYLIAGAYALSTYQKDRFSFHIDRSYNKSGWMLCIANGKREGGRYLISPESNNNDGIFEALFLKDISRYKLIIQFIKLSLGHNFDARIIRTYYTDKLELKEAEKYPIHIDGEQYQFTGTLRISICPKGLSVLRK